jgi:hypothetical protein
MANIARVMYESQSGEEKTFDYKIPMDDLFTIVALFQITCDNPENADFIKLATADEVIETFMLDIVSYGLEAVMAMAGDRTIDNPRPDKQVDALVKKWGINDDRFWGTLFLVLAMAFDEQLKEQRENK